GKPAPTAALGAAGGDSGDGEPMTLSYEGPLSGLLDQVAAHFGINWRYDGSVITFSKFETRIFMVEALPGKGKYSDKISGDSGGGGGGSGGGGGGSSSSSSLTQDAELQADLDIWSEIGNTINAMLAGTGTAVIAPSVGTITVTTTSDVMKRISRYISEQNGRMTRQIAINVSVYTADIENEDDFNNQFAAALKSIKPFSFAGVIAPSFSDGTSGDFSRMSIGIINNPNVSASSVITALSKITNNVRVAQFPMTTLNNVPITRRVGRDVAFLASAATTTTGTSGSTTTTLTPGTVREGFSLQLTPRLLSDGRMLLQYSLNLTDLVSITTFASGTGASASSVQLPVTASRVFVQQSLLRSGSTLVLSGYSQDQTNQNANGTLNPYNFLLGGGIGNDKKKTLLLVTITPQELDVPPLEQP
ncbi:MAG: secretin N-terminal domain-containing protein, partial [Hyphomicrobium sp.]